MSDRSISEDVASIASRHPGLDLLVLHGSRARRDYGPDSDWKFAYLADNRFDSAALLADLVILLSTDKVELATLKGASFLLRYRVAKDGQLLYEARQGAFEDYWLTAVSQWCDWTACLEAQEISLDPEELNC